MKYKRLLLWLVLLMGAVSTHAQEAYFSVKFNDTRLSEVTFYYDNNRAQRENCHLVTNDGSPLFNNDVFSERQEEIDITFDSSFANYRPTNTSYWFSYTLAAGGYVTFTGWANLNTSQVTNMSYMFDGLTVRNDADYPFDLTHFNTANVTNMTHMLANMKEWSGMGLSLDLSSFTFKSGVTATNIVGASVSSLILPATANNLPDDAFADFSCENLTFSSNLYPLGAVQNSGYYTWKGGEFSGYIPGDPTGGLVHAYFTVDNIDPESSNVTFYYDNKRAKRQNTITVTENGSPLFNENVFSQAQSDIFVTFDSSFANYRPTNTSRWFSYTLAEGGSVTFTGWANLNTSQVTNMSYMFDGLTVRDDADYPFDLTHFNTANATNMLHMLANMKEWSGMAFSIDLSSFTFNSGTMTSGLLSNTILKELKLPATANNLEGSAFSGVGSTWSHNITLIYPSDFYPAGARQFNGYIEWKAGYFNGTLTRAYLSKSNPSILNCDDQYVAGSDILVPDDGADRPIYSAGHTFRFASSFAYYRPSNTSHWFQGLGDVYDADSEFCLYGMENLNTSEVKNMSYMFYNAKYGDNQVEEQELDLSHFDTRKVTDMRYMFAGFVKYRDVVYDVNTGTWTGYSLGTLDISSFTINENTNSRYMFENAQIGTIILPATANNLAYDAFLNVGSPQNPCTLVFPTGVSPLGAVQYDGYYTWKGGYFSGVPICAYAVFDDNTLTFYYDQSKPSRSGTVYELNTGYNRPAWKEKCSYVTKVVFDPSFANARPTSCYHWFEQMTSLTSITGIEYLKTDEVTNMRDMFYFCCELTSLDLSGFNTANVDIMDGMFYGCSKLESVDVSGFDTGNVTNMREMFRACEALTSVDVSGFNTANVTDMYGLFESCYSLTSVDVSGFNTANVTNMGYMFYDCSSLTSVDVSGFNTEKVTSMSRMFYDCSKLDSLNLSRFNLYSISSTERMDALMFNCHSLKYLVIPASAGIFGYSACYGVGTESAPCTLVHSSSFTPEKTSEGDGWYVWKRGYFKDADPEPYAEVDGYTLRFCYDTNFFFSPGKAYKLNSEANTPGWYADRSSVTRVVFDPSFANVRPKSCYYWFANMSRLTNINGIGNLKTDEVTNMYGMFRGCTSLSALNLSGFNTTNVETMAYMFLGCSSLTSLDVSGFNTANVRSMGYMFYGCYNLTSLDVSGFNTEKVAVMSRMFYACSNLTSLDLSSFIFNTSSTESEYILQNCSNLQTLVIPSTADRLNNNACMGVGTQTAPCTLVYPDGFGFEGLSVTFRWKNGYFKNGVKEAYAVLDGSTLSFYCDMKKSIRTGTLYELNTGTTPPRWNSDNYRVATVVFDASFADARPTTCLYWFTNMSRLTTITGIEYLKTDDVESMRNMFAGCSGLTSLDLSGFDTGKVVDMAYMFASCSKLESLDVSGFNTARVSNMSNMFANCSKLESLDLSSFTFNFESSSTASRTFLYRCGGLQMLTIPASAGNLNATACSGVGTQAAPCMLVYPAGFTPEKTSTGDGWYMWKSGYFKDYILLGDANGDKDVTVADAVAVVNYAVKGERPDWFAFKNADVDGNKEISVNDLTGIVNLVLGKASSAPSNALFSYTDAVALTGSGNELTLHLNESAGYTATQMVLTLPEDCRLTDARMFTARGNGHRVVTRSLGDGRYLLVVYSATGKMFNHSGSGLLRLQVSGAHHGDVGVSGIQMVDADVQTMVLDDAYGIATGLDWVSADDGETDGDWYNINGVKVKTPQRGVYIKDGQKVARKK